MAATFFAPAVRGRSKSPGIQTLLVRLVLAVYLPALVAVASLVVQQVRSEHAAIEEDLGKRTAALGLHLQRHLGSIESRLASLAEDPALAAGDWPELDRAARRLAAEAALDGVVLTQRDGAQVINTRFALEQEKPRVAPRLLQTVNSGKSRWMDAVRPQGQDELMIGVAVPVLKGGRLLYSLAGGQNVSRLQDLLAEMPEGWISAIADASGTVVARVPDAQKIVGRQMTDDFRDLIAGKDQGIARSVTIDGKRVLTSFRTLRPQGWTVVVSVPENTLFAPAWIRAAWVAVGAAILLAFGLLVALSLRRSIVLAMEALADQPGRPKRPIAIDGLPFREAQTVAQRLHDTAWELARARDEVDRAHAKFHHLFLQEADRRQARIATELHDDVGSTLAGASMFLTRVAARTSEDTQELVGQAQALIDRAAAAVRDISRGIMPAGDQQGALVTALEQLASNVDSHDSACVFRHRGNFDRIPPAMATHLYRIAQEAVTNAKRHARTTCIQLSLSKCARYGRLTIEDDGPGFREEQVLRHSGLGLRSMRARTLAISGEFRISRSRLGGARVRVTFPITEAGADALDR